MIIDEILKDSELFAELENHPHFAKVVSMLIQDVETLEESIEDFVDTFVTIDNNMDTLFSRVKKLEDTKELITQAPTMLPHDVVDFIKAFDCCNSSNFGCPSCPYGSYDVCPSLRTVAKGLFDKYGVK